MMKRGKKICNTLKEVRMQVAKANDIKYAPTECRHEGDCTGTCPKNLIPKWKPGNKGTFYLPITFKLDKHHSPTLKFPI